MANPKLTVYIVDIETRKGDDNGTLGPYRTKARAIKAVKDYVEDGYRPESIKHCLAEFGGSLEKGEFYSEDETITILERDIED